jgi:rod shape-determining protein MreC
LRKRRFQGSSIGTASVSAFRSRRSSIIFGACALLILLLTSINQNLNSRIRKHTYDVFTPVILAVSKPIHGMADQVKRLSTLTSLKEENARLTSENIRLRAWYNRAVELQTENASLRALLNVVPDPGHSFISARIISDVGSSFAKTLMVKGGLKQNIAEGQAVLSSQGLIGRIIETSQGTARVLLVTDINSRVPVYIEGINQHAVMAGQNNDRPELLYLPPDVKVEKGQRVITSGYGGIFPQGLPIGVIEHIEQHTENGTLKHVPLIRLYTDFNGLLYVRVVNTGT